MDVYRSSPPLPGIFCPFHLLPSAHAPPKSDPKESLSMESYIYIVLIVSLVVQKLEGWLEKMRAGSGALARATVLGLIIQKGFAQLHGSAGPRHNLAITGKPVYFALNYFLSCFSSSGFIF